LNVLIWHVHGSWTTAFVQGPHTYVVPVVPDRGPDGRGRAQTWSWPASAVERTPDELTDTPIDVVIVQRPRDLELAERWLGGRRPGRDVGLIWLEHNAPQGRINELCHPARNRDDLTIVHVTHTNALYWDTGSTPTTVVEHGVIDPGHRYRGDIEASGIVVNEPRRRARVTGTDLFERFGSAAPVHLFGMGADDLADALGRPAWLEAFDDVPQQDMHDELARRRCYVHPFRWTSLGLSLIEAMLLGMPVVALATTDVPAAVPEGAGVVSNDLDELLTAVEHFRRDPAAAVAAGRVGRAHAIERYSLDRFLSQWDRLLEDSCR
jgi:hypothetical protein